MYDGTSMPFVPGYTFTNPIKKNFTSKQSLRYSKGCPFSDPVVIDTPRYALQLLDAENRLYDDTLIDLTYGSRRDFLKKNPVPEYVAQDKEVLRFYGYFREEIDDTWSEEFRIHHVKLLYYLDDDEIELWEPRVENSGLVQGKLLKKQVVPKPNGLGMYKWKDLNIGLDVVIYGKKIRLVNCDTWTKEYIESAGIVVNPKVEEIPEDSFGKKLRERSMKPVLTLHNIEDDKLWKFMNNNRHVLRFYALWDDTTCDPKEMRKVVVHYYLEDDTIEVREVHYKNNGRDPFPCVIGRQKVPHDIYSLPETFPSIYLEYGNKEVREWFAPKDLGVGKTIVLMQRKIFLYNCDNFTRQYYRDNYDIDMPAAIDVEEKPKKPFPKAVPPHDGFGTWEDSLQSCIYGTAHLPKKDLLKFYLLDNKFLRFSARMDTEWPINRTRQFVITFFPADDTVAVYEQKIENSGIAGGYFLSRCRLKKPGADAGTNRPVHYTANDFYIGAVIFASGQKFVINDADRYVLTFMEANSQYYPPDLIEIHRKRLAETRLAVDPMKSSKEWLQTEMRNCIVRKFGEEPLPLPLDLEGCRCTRDMMMEKFYATNVPIPRNLLEQALDLCSEDDKDISLPDLKKIFLNSFGHKPPN